MPNHLKQTPSPERSGARAPRSCRPCAARRVMRSQTGTPQGRRRVKQAGSWGWSSRRSCCAGWHARESGSSVEARRARLAQQVG